MGWAYVQTSTFAPVLNANEKNESAQFAKSMNKSKDLKSARTPTNLIELRRGGSKLKSPTLLKK